MHADDRPELVHKNRAGRAMTISTYPIKPRRRLAMTLHYAIEWFAIFKCSSAIFSLLL